MLAAKIKKAIGVDNQILMLNNYNSPL